MKFQGNLSIARPVEKVWEFLWDIEKLTSCIPGCESVKTIKDREKYELKVKDSVGPITVHLDLLAEVKKLEPLKSIEIAMEGKDFKAGGVRQTMTLVLTRRATKPRSISRPMSTFSDGWARSAIHLSKRRRKA